MQPLNGYSSSIIEGCGILGDYPLSFDHIKRSSGGPLQRTHRPLKFAETRSRQTVLPFSSRQNSSSDYTIEEDYTTVLTPPSDPHSWPSGYSYETSQVPNQNDDYYDGWEDSTEESGRYVVDTLRLNNGAHNQRIGTVKRFFETCHPPTPALPPPLPPPSLHPLPLHPPPQQHPYLHPLPPSQRHRHQPGLDEAFQVSTVCRNVEESFGTNHLQEATRRQVAKQRRPFLPELHRQESRDPTGSCFGQECFEENVEISLKKTRRVLLPTPKNCSATDPSSSTSSRSAPTPTAEEGGGGVWTNASTSATLDKRDVAEPTITVDAETRRRVLGPSPPRRVLGPSPPRATHQGSSNRPHHHPTIRPPDAIRIVPPIRQPTHHQPPSASSPPPPPPPPPQHPPPPPTQHQHQHRQVMRTASLDESDARSNGNREAKGFSIGRGGASSSISDSDDRQKDSYICQICRVRCHSLENFDVHMQSDEHRRLMKAIASVHLQKTKQRLKTLKVNRKQRLKFTNNAKRRNHRSVGLKRSWMTSPATTTATAAPPTTTTKDGIKCKTTSHNNAQAEKVPMNGTAQKPGKEKPGSCIPNKAKFLLECTLHRQNEEDDDDDDDAHPIWLTSSDRNNGGAKPNASQLPKGQECIVSVSGFLCKLCNKFYNDETSAKVTHCSSRKHICKYREMLKMMKTFRESSTVENTNCGC